MFLQLLKGVLGSYWPTKKEPSLDLEQPYLRSYRVWPHLIDYNLHLNNAKYLMLLEHSRWNFFIDNGWFKSLYKRRLSFVVAAVELTFIRELRLFKKFEVHTQIIGWNQKYIYIEQKIKCGDVLYAHAVFKAAMLQNGRRVLSSEFFEWLGFSLEAEKHHVYISKWGELAESKKQLASSVK